MTQEDVAEIMHTKKPAVLRLESCDDEVRNFPSRQGKSHQLSRGKVWWNKWRR